MADAAYIVAATRTAGGRKGGKLAGWHPIDLGAAVLDFVLDRTGDRSGRGGRRGDGLRRPGRRAEPQRSAQRRACLAHARKRAGHQRRSSVRLLATGAAVRRAGGDERHPGHRHRLGRREHDPGADGPLGGAAGAGRHGQPEEPADGGSLPQHPVQPVRRRRDGRREVQPDQGPDRRVRLRHHPARHRGDARRRVQGRDHPDQDQGRRGGREPPHRRRGHPLRRLAGRHQGREAAARGRADHRRHLQPDLRRRLGGDGGLREGAEGAWPDAARPHPPRVGRSAATR